ncbi:MAG: AMP-binding protein [Candidatus Pacebacteria bacterium]|nr:AMP-binding protein [Candidatus Paceibacterota bacterium]
MCIVSLLLDQLISHRQPDDHIAIESLTLTGEGCLVTYGELRPKIIAMTHLLYAKGIGKSRGQRVIIMAPDCAEMVIAYLAVMAFGATAVAVNYRLTKAEIEAIIVDAKPSHIIVDNEFRPSLPATKVQKISLDLLWQNLGKVKKTDPFSIYEFGPERYFWVYSSGTTGKPKAVVHSFSDIYQSSAHLQNNLLVTPQDRIFVTSKCFFAYALGISIFGALRLGATVILMREWPSDQYLRSVIYWERPTIIFSVPTLYRRMIYYPSPFFESVRVFVSAGERLPTVIQENCIEQLGKPILDSFGTSESLFMIFGGSVTPDGGFDWRPNSCGKPIKGVKVKLLPLTGESAQDFVAPDHVEIGILSVKMGSLFSHYWGQPEATERVLQDGWFTTGDVFSRDSDGYYYHHGRADDLLRLNGHWVAPAEIEFHALNISGIQDAAVVGCESPDGLMRPVLFIDFTSPIRGAALTKLMTDQLKPHLAEWKIPREVIVLPSLPRTATGKVKRNELREIYNSVHI